jgi:hypothetical protein
MKIAYCLIFQEPVLTAHPSRMGGTPSRHTCLPAGREDAKRDSVFWRIGERLILQKFSSLRTITV